MRQTRGAEIMSDAAKAPVLGRSLVPTCTLCLSGLLQTATSLLPIESKVARNTKGLTETVILRVMDMLACQRIPFFSKHGLQTRAAVQTRVCAAPNDASVVFFRYLEFAVSYQIVH